MDRLKRVQAVRGTHVGIVLAPRVIEMPVEIARFDDPFLPYCKAVIGAARGSICAVVFDLAAFLALGAAGAVALERAIAYARGDGETVIVLHGPFATGAYAASAGETGFAADIVTVTDTSIGAAFTAVGVEVVVCQEALPDTLMIGDTPIALVGEAVIRAARRADYLETIQAAIEERKRA